MSKHTPGPWEVRADAHGRGRIYARGTWIATTWLATDDGNDAPRLPALSNARLIAAAPELLEALGILLNRLEGIGGEHVTGMEGVDADLIKARAAIAKATGEHHDN